MKPAISLYKMRPLSNLPSMMHNWKINQHLLSIINGILFVRQIAAVQLHTVLELLLHRIYVCAFIFNGVNFLIAINSLRRYLARQFDSSTVVSVVIVNVLQLRGSVGWLIRLGESAIYITLLQISSSIRLPKIMKIWLLVVVYSLPLDIRNSSTISCFRRQLKTFYKAAFRPP